MHNSACVQPESQSRMQTKRGSIVHGVKKLAGAFTSATAGMLKVQHTDDHRQSRTSLASIFEDLAHIRKSILGHGSLENPSQRSWIEKTFMKRECSKFIRSSRDAGKCCCGRPESWQGHVPQAMGLPSEERWHPYRHTEAKPTDSYGVLEFQGAPHPSKAQYVRLSSYDTKADQVLQLLQNHWGLDLPKLLITVHGGILNFDLQPKLKRVFRKGLLKAAKTTGAWIITGGTNTGVTRHVGDAISDRTLKAKNKIIAIGISPWGIVENKDDLIGKDVIVPYHCVSSPKTNYSVLNNNHSYFLLVDNGTVGKYGGEVIFRKRLEKYIASQRICITSGVKGRGVPVICVVLEGGANTIRSVLEYVTDTPPVPVVVCDGSGRAADLIAFTHKYCQDDGTMPESLRDQLILTIQRTFQYTQEQAEKLFIELMLCVKKKELITVFRMGEGAQDIDLAILTALLKGTNASAPDQLSLALTWDRVDIARSHIFVYGQDWPEGSLEQAMMDALINDRVDFVKLLLENGVHMQSFLTIPRLEELYNTRQGPSNTLRYLVRDVKKHFPSGYRYTLPDIGLVLQHLMGGAFRATYCRKRFRQKYNALKRNGTSQGNIGSLVTTLPTLVSTKQAEELFPYPFHDLMIWAVLMKRQKMAMFMWQHGEEALAKALMACKLYKAMAQEADQDDLEIEIPDEIRRYAGEFQTLALELLEHCYKIDDDYTQQLLTYELKNFSEQTCLSLAVAANHRTFIAHGCCQMLLNDMWMGGLRMRKSTSMKVLLGIFLPPYILALEFKSKEELQLMPQTMEEHLDELDSNYSDNENLSVSSFEDDQIHQGSSQSHNNYMDELESSFTSQAHNGGVPGSSGGPGGSGVPGGVGGVPGGKENGVLLVDNSIYSNHIYKKKKSPLRLGKKIGAVGKHSGNNYMDELESSFTSQAHNGGVPGSSGGPGGSGVPVGVGGVPGGKENGVLLVDNSIYSNHIYKKKKSPLRLGKKIYEFYNAPITKFWAHTLSYFVFLLMFTVTVLGKFHQQPRWSEYYIMGYIGTLGIEKIRQVIAAEPTTIKMKLKVYCGSYWNLWDTFSILLFTAAVLTRFLHREEPKAARVLYIVNIVFWNIRNIEILSVNKYLGPYVKIIAKLLRDMCYFLTIVLIAVTSFGVVRQAIHFPDEEPSWFHVRNVFFYPYWMIYGELFADEIDTCTDPVRIEQYENGELAEVCAYGSWVAPLFMFVFLLMANILFVNLLIARFNATFARTNANAREIWKFQRYQLIINYELRPILPPPLIIFSHIYLALKYIKRRCQGKRDNFDSGLKLFLSHDDMEKLHDFEEECAEDYFREKELQLQSSSDKRIQVINERVENMTLRMDDMHQKENTIKLSLQSMDFRLSFLEEIGRQNLDMMGQLKTFMSQLDVARPRHTSSSSNKSSRMHLDSEDSVSDQLDVLHYDDRGVGVGVVGSSSGSSNERERDIRERDIGTAGRRKQFAQGSSSETEKLLTPENTTNMRSMPSPILVHSQKTLKDDTLHQFTDYTKPVIKTSSSLSRRSLDRSGSQKTRRSLPKLVEQSPECGPRSPILKAASMSPPQARGSSSNEASLLGRRRGNLSKLRIDPLDDEAEPGTSTDGYETRHRDANTNLNNSRSLYSTAHIGCDTCVSTQNPAEFEIVDISQGGHHDDNPLTMTGDSGESQQSGPPYLHISIPSPEPSPEIQQQPVYAIPFTPILTARSVEYTTITDEIDTTCMMNISPPRSPSTAVPQSDTMWDDEKPEHKAVIKEKVTLKLAEETEHRKMEKVIRNRLRQISMDESDSISDIARLVINDMEVEDPHSDHEEEDMHGSSESLVAQSGASSLQPGSVSSREWSRDCSCSAERDLRGSPIQFEAVEIRIRRASTLEEDTPHPHDLSKQC